ncbi:MAG: hypothetical protein JNM17_26905 [Archangium sp.]|nr:hypothetical protein [Archangium sp.]
MAKPPEWIDEVLPGAESAVMAVVSKVLEQSPQKPQADTQASSTPDLAARQLVELDVKSVVFGKPTAGAKVKAWKPAGAYALREGNQGPFVLGASKDGGVEILGRYGPDTWPEGLVREAAKRHKKS